MGAGEIKPWNRNCSDCQSVESSYPCPLSECLIHSSNKNAVNWVHSNCEGCLRLYDNGKEKCQKCGEEDLFCLWNYNCSQENKNKHISSFKIRALLQYLVGLNDQDVNPEFWINIKACFNDQMKRYPSKFDN